MPRHAVLALGCFCALALVASGCSKKRRSYSSTTNSTTGATTSGGGGGGGITSSNLLLGLTPARGPSSGGTEVTLTGRDFVSGASVSFGGVPGVDVRVVAADTILVKTPPHPAGFVDVTVSTPAGAGGRLANAFNFENTGPMARPADWGDPTPGEQELLELMNRARKDPVAEGARLGLDFSAYPARPPLAHNKFLGDAALAHALDMANRPFYAHVNPDGVGPNGRLLLSPYPLNTFYGTDRVVNLTESIGVANGNRFLTPQDVHDTFMIDAGLAQPKHREIMLGYGGHYPRTREAGLAYRTNVPSTSVWTHYVTEEFAFSRNDKPFLLGTVYDDATADGLCRIGEGRGGVQVTLGHASGFQVTTTTASAGGFAFEVFVDAEYTLTIEGKSQRVLIQGGNKKVDLRSGVLVAQ